MPEGVRLAASAMGTRFELVLHADDPLRLRAAGEEAVREILALHRGLSAFDRASDVSRLNREAAARPVRIDTRLFDLLLLCRDLWRDTRGAFDVTIGPMMKALGFRGRAHDSHACAQARASVGFKHVELDEAAQTVRYTRQGVEIDLGGVGKGFALDCAAEVLRDSGVENAFLHGGASTSIAIGRDAGGRPWRVALDDSPDAPVVALHDQALSVSASTGRTTATDRGDVIGHIVHPGSGACPARFGPAAALADSAAVSDAWSTAAAIEWPEPGHNSVSLALRTGEGEAAAWRLRGPWPLTNPEQGHLVWEQSHARTRSA